MYQVQVNIPSEVLYDTHMKNEEATAFARQMVALGYYTKTGFTSAIVLK